MRTIVIGGITVTGDAAAVEKKLVNEPPLSSILSGGIQYVSTATLRWQELTVKTSTPATGANEIQLTDVNKFKITVSPDNMTDHDLLILKVVVVGEITRP